MKDPPAPSRDLALLLVACGVCALVSFWRIGNESLWFDEVFAVNTSRDLAALRQVFAQMDPNMAVYHLLLHPLLRLGESEALVRAPSAVFAVLACAALYFLGLRLADRAVAFAACLAFALHPLVRLYAQEARGYSLAALLVTSSALALVSAVQRPAWWRWALFSLSGALAFYTHYVTFFCLAAQVLSLLALRRAPYRPLSVATLGMALLMIPGAALMIGPNLIFPSYPNPRLSELWLFVSSLAVDDLALLAAEASLVLLAAGWAVARTRAAGRGDEAFRTIFPLALALVPPCALVGMSFAVQPELVPRFLVPSAPALALVLAIGWRSVPGAWARGVLAAGYLALCASLVWQQGMQPAKEDWRGLTAHVLSASSSSDALVFFAPFLWSPFDHYRDRLGAQPSAPQRVELVDWNAPRGPGGIPPFVAERVRALPLQHRRIWLVVGHAMDWLGRGEQLRELEGSLASCCVKVDEVRFEGGLRVALWEAPPG